MPTSKRVAGGLLLTTALALPAYLWCRARGGAAGDWAGVLPLVPLTYVTFSRYTGTVADPEFLREAAYALGRLAWWCLPCLGSVAILVAVPHLPGRPLSRDVALAWLVGTLALVTVAAVHGRRFGAGRARNPLEGAVSLDCLWTAYALAVVFRPRATGEWLAPAAFLWPWVAPASGAVRVGVAGVWAGGVLPVLVRLWGAPVLEDGPHVLAVLGWLAGDAPAWGLVCAGFVAAAGAALLWWAMTAHAGTPPGVGYAGSATKD